MNSIAVTATRELLLSASPARLHAVRVIDVDEHKSSHVLSADADAFVTVITDLTDVVAGHSPARLLYILSKRSAAALTGWLSARDQAFRHGVRIVAMHSFGCYKNAAVEQLPEAVTLIDPFHVVALAAQKLDLYRQRVQQDTLGHRGRSGDPLYGVRRALRTRDQLLTERQYARIGAVFAYEAHAAVETTSCAYQQLIDAYAATYPQRAKTLLASLIYMLHRELPAALDELATLALTLHRRRDYVLAYFTHRASNCPTEAINSLLEALRRNALRFRNLINYRILSLSCEPLHADWNGVFAHHHTDDVVVDWKGQAPTHGIEQHIDAMKAYVESAGGTPPQITSHRLPSDLGSGPVSSASSKAKVAW